MTALSAPVDGFRLAYDRHGGGRPVVLLHGWPGDFGESDKHVADPAAAYSADGQAGRVVGLVEELGLERPVFCGYDIGSRIAQAIARNPVHGVSTQRPEEQAAFAAAEDVPFPLLSDVDLRLAAALRLPSVRIGQQQRLKRAIVVVDADRVVRHAIFPITDIPAAVEEALTAAGHVAGQPPA